MIRAARFEAAVARAAVALCTAGAVPFGACALQSRPAEYDSPDDVPAPASIRPASPASPAAPARENWPTDPSPVPPTAGAGGVAATDNDGGWPGMTSPPHVFTDAERELYATLSPLPDVPPDSTNRFADDVDAAALGQKLFFDPRYSGPLAQPSDLGAVGDTGKVACASCHWGEYLDDQRAPHNVSLGADFHTRNALPVTNSAFYRWTNWGGRFSAQWELSLAVAENKVIMNTSRLAIAHHLFDEYRGEYEALFGAMEPALAMDATRFPPAGKPKPAPTAENPNPPDGAWEGMTAEDRQVVNVIFVNYGKLLEAYLRRLVSRNAPFDAFVAGDEAAISESAQRGLALFVGRARCVSCHLGPQFSDGLFHNDGVPQQGDHVPALDEGRAKDAKALLASPFTSASVYSDDPNSGRLAGLTDPPPAEALGAFRTPSLRGVSLTAPYMHSGQFETLWDVIEFYDRGGDEPVVGAKDPRMVPLHLGDEEKQDLVDFLGTLAGEPVPRELLVHDFDPPTGASEPPPPPSGW